MGIGLKKIISKIFTTMLLDEYNTSKKCCNCWQKNRKCLNKWK